MLLSDPLRNELLYRAIETHVSEGTSFLDVGSGTGVWAVAAALLGARRVVAVEREECLIPVIRQHVRENGVSDRIEIIRADVRELDLEGRFDVIVAELFGRDIYGVETVDSLIGLRDRFLTPDGVFIPQAMEIYAVPVHLKDPVGEIGAGLPLKTGFFESLQLNFLRDLPFAERGKTELLAEPKRLFGIDLTSIEEPPDLRNHSHVWNLGDISRANAFAVYNHSLYTDGIRLDSYRSKSWMVLLYEFLPFDVRGEGEIRLELTMKKEQPHWRVDLPSHPEERTRIYSPGFAFVRILMGAETPGDRPVP